MLNNVQELDVYIGHYAVSFALNRYSNKVPLWLLFLAVQLVDIVFYPLVLLGIEKMNIVENFTQSTHFELVYIPFTHSLLASFLWAIMSYAFIRLLSPKNKLTALVVAVAVLSHWFLDLLVHTPDLPLYTDTSTKLGFGLWNNAIATYSLEAILLIAGLYIYLQQTKASTKIGKYGMGLFVIVLLVINGINIFGPLTNDDQVGLATLSLFLYLAFAGIAYWLENKRLENKRLENKRIERH